MENKQLTAMIRRMRSMWRGPFVVDFPIPAKKEGTTIKTDQRNCTVMPNYVGVKFLVHNGKDYIPVLITEEMIGHKLGDFSPTKKFVKFKESKKKH